MQPGPAGHPAPDDDPAFRLRVRQVLDDRSGDIALARIEFDRIDRVAEFFGEGVAEFVQDELLLRLQADAVDPSAVYCPAGGMAMILIPVPSDEVADLNRAAWALMERLSAAIDVGISQVSIGCTVGIAAPGVLIDRSVAGLINAASAASRRASAMGSRSAAAFVGVHELSGRRGELDRSIFTALGTDQIGACFQARVRVADGGIVGAQALARWRHPMFGAVSADEFVPEAHRSGLIRQIDRRVLDEAFRAATQWPVEARLAVGVSPASLDDPTFVDHVSATLAGTGLAPDRVTFEVKGFSQEADLEGYARSMRALKQSGSRLCLDGLDAIQAYVGMLGEELFDEV